MRLRIALIFMLFLFAESVIMVRAAYANDIVSRKGLAPDQEAKVAKSLARNRLIGQEAAGQAAAHGATAQEKDCTTSIGNIDLSGQRPGVRVPKDNIVVIKAPVVNKC
ncbi:hypothetical protein [Paraburkholderia tropica]|uniref:hypothetical protein n=1 Tax=Paraburkholderia tropica TaxID=92647 RepID=UPI002AB61267|nr:hypothetical protein [Paraburkholderia tropica]